MRMSEPFACGHCSNVATIAALMGHAVGKDAITMRYLNVHSPEMMAAMACLWDEA